MKQILFSILIALALFSCSNSHEKIDTLQVLGNCGMCKKNIETSLEIDGVYFAEWNKKTKVLTVAYDSILFSKETIATYVAKVGYDNELVKGDDDAYNNLHSCCQYDRK